MDCRAGRVLIIEDEPLLRAAMVRGLARLPGVAVVGVGTFREAVRALETARPQLILSDLDLPDRCGLGVMEELARLGWSVPVVFISAYVRAFGAQPRDLAGVSVMEKPMGLDALHEVVTRHLGAPAAQAPAPFGLGDYMQLASMGRHPVTIELVGHGAVELREGQVWSARDGEGEGLPAMQRLLAAPPCAIHCEAARGTPGPRNLEGSAEAVLLEATRRLAANVQRMQSLADEGAAPRLPLPRTEE